MMLPWSLLAVELLLQTNTDLAFLLLQMLHIKDTVVL